MRLENFHFRSSKKINDAVETQVSVAEKEEHENYILTT